MMKRTWVAALGAALALASTTPEADAFCGFYVSGADAKLFNNATLVVLMRDGTRTVLSMQNNYEGPPDDFAMVVPVPVVLQEENVKTLPREIFAKVNQMAAPRLVEYWEQDPCGVDRRHREESASMAPAPQSEAKAARSAEDYQVKIEAQFTVGEYDIVILSAQDSSGLDRWLRDNQYKIPDAAEPVLRPYVESGMKFFVAKVNADKVTFDERDGKKMAMLSPLRFYYDSDTFSLPVRLGLLNSNGTQDLLIHILAPNKRYEVANYPNVTIPTNLDVADGAKESFGPFYAALFDKTLELNPKAVVTEYAWAAQTCDPCPGPTLTPADMMTLGADVPPDTSTDDGTWVPRVLFGTIEGEPVAQRQLRQLTSPLTTCFQRARESDPKLTGKVSYSLQTNDKGDVTSVTVSGAKLPASLESCSKGAFQAARFAGVSSRKLTVPVEFSTIRPGGVKPYTLTRLHARYGKDTLGEDLVFKEAAAIVGGREVRNDGKLENGASAASMNNFQARYAIRHPWTGPIECKNPRRGVWGGPPPGVRADGNIKAALDLAFAPRGKTDLAGLLRQDVPELKLKAVGVPGPSGGADKGDSDPDREPAKKADTKSAPTSGCACSTHREPLSALGWLSALGALAGALLRRAGKRR